MLTSDGASTLLATPVIDSSSQQCDWSMTADTENIYKLIMKLADFTPVSNFVFDGRKVQKVLI